MNKSVAEGNNLKKKKVTMFNSLCLWRQRLFKILLILTNTKLYSVLYSRETAENANTQPKHMATLK